MSHKAGQELESPVQLQQASDVAALFAQSKRMLVAVGAGISVSCGIPDFRSEKIGLYTSGRHIQDGIPSAELFFDIDYFLLDPAPFYRMFKSLVQKNYVPSKTHNFLRLLEKMGKIKRIYTQNIDGLERSAGCESVVQCHGSVDSMRCLKCKKKDTLEYCKKDFVERNSVPYCRFCRSGVMKPEIVFFGESCPAAVSRSIKKDALACDLVIVMGTSLKVKGPVTQLLDFVPDHIPRILINNELVTYIPVTSGGTSVPLNSRTAFSAALIGSCDDVTQYICDLNGWSNDLTLLSRERASIKQEDASKPKDTIHKSEAIDMKTTQLIAIPVRRSQRPRSLKRSIEMVYEDSSIDGTSVSCFDVADSNVDIANSDKKSSACDPRCEIEPGAIVFETEEVNPHVFRLQRRRLID